MHRVSLSAGLVAVALVGLTAAPGAAATTATAEATALVATVGGQPVTTGSYTVTNSGEGQQATGSREPAVPALLAGQGALAAGTLFQDAVAGGGGSSAACAGIAGDSATLVQVGDGTSCFDGADNARLTLAEFDPSSLTAQLPKELRDALGAAAAPLQEQLDAALAQLPAGGLYLDLTGIESQCTAQPPQGDSLFADVHLRAAVAEEETNLLDFDNHYAPNTELPTDLQPFYDQLMSDLEQALETGLGGQSGPLSEIPAELRNQALQDALAQLGEQLAPLQDQVVKLTLNKQERTDDSITVTAVDLDVLPAANSHLDGQALSIELGTSTCEAAHRADPAEPTPEPELPAYPTSVPAGDAAPVGPVGNIGEGGFLGVVMLIVLAAGASLVTRRG